MTLEEEVTPFDLFYKMTLEEEVTPFDLFDKMTLEEEVTPFDLFDNVESTPGLPNEMNESHLTDIICFTILVFFSTIGNIIFLSMTLKRRKTSRSGINTILMHLAIANLLVTFLMIPSEIISETTIRWVVGDKAIWITPFLRIFGFYLSSFIMVCICIDRCFAVFKTNNNSDSKRRANVMLKWAWEGSVVLFVLEMFIYFRDYVDEGKLLMILVMCYIFPLVVIITSSLIIFCKIYCCSKQSISGEKQRRTLKMTVSILAVFLICWTPQYVIEFWNFFAPIPNLYFNFRTNTYLYLFGCTNVCINPIVYAAFNLRIRRGAACPVMLRNASSSDITCRTDIDMSVHTEE